MVLNLNAVQHLTCHVIIVFNENMNEKKRGATPLCFPPSLRHPPLTVKRHKVHTARGLGRSSLCQPTDQDFPRRPMGTEATCPCLVSYQEGLRLFEVGSREELGQILGHIVRDHGGSFPSTLTNLNRASRKKRPALDQDL